MIIAAPPAGDEPCPFGPGAGDGNAPELVYAPRRMVEAARQPVPAPPRARPRRSAVRLAMALLRVHQWVKNLLVFVPPVAAHQTGRSVLVLAGVAFLSFSLCASSAYIVNDLRDLENDRRNPAKARRPLAAGEVGPRTAIPVAVACLVAALALAWGLLPAGFVALAGGYWAVSVSYSLWLKRVPMLDVIVLAGLYALRVLGGTLATGVPTSSWLFTFAMFLFLSLALLKRTSEVQVLRITAREAVAGRGYAAQDVEVLAQLGTASGFLAVLVLALYISNPDVTRLYEHHERLWLLCPLGLYWVGRVWLLARRGRVQEDPVVFALRDRPSYLVALAAMIVVYAAI